jgi:hypothetical protein
MQGDLIVACEHDADASDVQRFLRDVAQRIRDRVDIAGRRKGVGGLQQQARQRQLLLRLPFGFDRRSEQVGILQGQRQ